MPFLSVTNLTSFGLVISAWFIILNDRVDIANLPRYSPDLKGAITSSIDWACTRGWSPCTFTIRSSSSSFNILAASAILSVPDCASGGVIITLPAKPSTEVLIRSSSVATNMPSRPLALDTLSTTC